MTKVWRLWRCDPLQRRISGCILRASGVCAVVVVRLFKCKVANHFARLASLFAALVSQGRVLWAGRSSSPGRVDLVDALAMPDKVEVDVGHFGDGGEYDVNGCRRANKVETERKKEEMMKVMPWFSFFPVFGCWMDGWMVLEYLSHEKGKEELFFADLELGWLCIAIVVTFLRLMVVPPSASICLMYTVFMLLIQC